VQILKFVCKQNLSVGTKLSFLQEKNLFLRRPLSRWDKSSNL